MDVKQKFKLTQIKKHKKRLSDTTSISLNEIVGSEKCQKIISECRDFRDRIYTPLKTLFVFIKQVLNPDKSCKNAVAELYGRPTHYRRKDNIDKHKLILRCEEAFTRPDDERISKRDGSIMRKKSIN